METPCLTDPRETPSGEVLGRCLGRVKAAWDAFIGYMAVTHPSFSAEWRYYNDGKCWLFKVQRKKKTICWVSVCRRMFRATFYFTEAASDAIRKSGLPREYVEQFDGGPKYGKIKGITVNVRKRADLEAAKILMGIKERLL